MNALPIEITTNILEFYGNPTQIKVVLSASFERRQAALTILRALIKWSSKPRSWRYLYSKYMGRCEIAGDYKDPDMSEFIVATIARASPDEREMLFCLMRGRATNYEKIFRRFIWALPNHLLKSEYLSYY